MSYDSFRLCARDGCQLLAHCWLPAQEPRALLLIAHGMAEHAGRYAGLAGQLCQAGYGAFALDLRGHGGSVEGNLPGHFADAGGWHKLIDDHLELNHLIRRQFPQSAIVLLGHSLGSHIALAYLLRYSCSVSAAILSSASYQPLWWYRTARLIAQLECWRLGRHGRSALLNWLSPGSRNPRFGPARTAFDWLSRDSSAVDADLADPRGGFRGTNQLWLDLLGGLAEITPRRALERIDAELPLLVLDSTREPPRAGRRQPDLWHALRAAGLNNVDLKLYPDERHALFHESQRDEVIRDLLDWLAQLPARQPYCPV